MYRIDSMPESQAVRAVAGNCLNFEARSHGLVQALEMVKPLTNGRKKTWSWHPAIAILVGFRHFVTLFKAMVQLQFWTEWCIQRWSKMICHDISTWRHDTTNKLPLTGTAAPSIRLLLQNIGIVEKWGPKFAQFIFFSGGLRQFVCSIS